MACWLGRYSPNHTDRFSGGIKGRKLRSLHVGGEVEKGGWLIFWSTITPPWEWLLRVSLIVPSGPLPPSHSAQPACSGDLLLQNKPPQNLVANTEMVIYFAQESPIWAGPRRDQHPLGSSPVAEGSAFTMAQAHGWQFEAGFCPGAHLRLSVMSVRALLLLHLGSQVARGLAHMVEPM